MFQYDKIDGLRPLCRKSKLIFKEGILFNCTYVFLVRTKTLGSEIIRKSIRKTYSNEQNISKLDLLTSYLLEPRQNY
jgi:hypothetical protein